jgi:hypothetical protein
MSLLRRVVEGKTKIQWTGQTWNPAVGCTKCSGGCDNSYAIRQALRYAAMDIPQLLFLETHMENSLNELREMETLTAAITAHLRVIQANDSDLEDLERLERHTAKIAANLRAIREDLTDLDELERQSEKIVRNLRSIQEP